MVVAGKRKDHAAPQPDRALAEKRTLKRGVGRAGTRFRFPPRNRPSPLFLLLYVSLALFLPCLRSHRERESLLGKNGTVIKTEGGGGSLEQRSARDVTMERNSTLGKESPNNETQSPEETVAPMQKIKQKEERERGKPTKEGTKIYMKAQKTLGPGVIR